MKVTIGCLFIPTLLSFLVKGSYSLFSSSGSLATIFDGSNTNAAVSFDLTSLHSNLFCGGKLRVESWRFNTFVNSGPGTANFEIYKRLGTALGNEDTSDGWSLLGSSTPVTKTAGLFVEEVISVDVGEDLVLEDNETVGIVTYSDTLPFLGCTNFPDPSSTYDYADGVLSIQAGNGMYADEDVPLFSGGILNGRIVNVEVMYTLDRCASCGNFLRKLFLYIPCLVQEFISSL